MDYYILWWFYMQEVAVVSFKIIAVQGILYLTYLHRETPVEIQYSMKHLYLKSSSLF